MERKNFAVLCAAVLCFWLFALALGTAQGVGLHLVARREAKTASAQAVWVEPALPAAAAPALSLNCRAAILIEQDSGRVLYEKNAEEKMPIASITKVMTLLLTFEAIHGGRLTLDTPGAGERTRLPHGRQPDLAGAGGAVHAGRDAPGHLRFLRQ